MKLKTISLLLSISLLLCCFLSLSSCKKKYEPIESTAQEKATVMTLSFDSKTYDVAYELYRAFFLQLKPTVDMGDSSVWTGENKNEYVQKIDKMILDRITDIYAVFYLCEKLALDAYSNKVNDKIYEYIVAAVEGGSVDGESFTGFGGDYNKYLSALSEMYLNYSVQELLIRYSIVLDMIYDYCIGTVEDGGNIFGSIKYTENDVRDFYFDGTKSVRYIRTFLSKDAFTEERAAEIQNSISQKTNRDEVVNYVINFSTANANDIKNGETIGKYSMDSFYYGDLTDAAFQLEIGEVSDVLPIKTDDYQGYNILYRIEPTEEHFEECYYEIRDVYLMNEVGKMIFDAKSALATSCIYSKTLTDLDRVSISMQ